MLRNLNIYNKYKLQNIHTHLSEMQVFGNTHIYSVVILSYLVSLHTFGITSGAFLALLLNLCSALQLSSYMRIYLFM